MGRCWPILGCFSTGQAAWSPTVARDTGSAAPVRLASCASALSMRLARASRGEAEREAGSATQCSERERGSGAAVHWHCVAGGQIPSLRVVAAFTAVHPFRHETRQNHISIMPPISQSQFSHLILEIAHRCAPPPRRTHQPPLDHQAGGGAAPVLPATEKTPTSEGDHPFPPSRRSILHLQAGPAPARAAPGLRPAVSRLRLCRLPWRCAPAVAGGRRRGSAAEPRFRRAADSRCPSGPVLETRA